MSREYLSTRSLSDLLYDLSYQSPHGSITTWSDCFVGCGRPARGGGVCTRCVEEELVRRGASPDQVKSAVHGLERRREGQAEYEQACLHIREKLAAN